MTKNHHIILVGIILLILITPLPCLNYTQATTPPQTQTDIQLPPPIDPGTIMEKSICRRMSIRSYTSQNLTDQELSTILWAGYGITTNGNRTIYSPTGIYATVIYVIRSDNTYTYNPKNHSLILFKTGNHLNLGQATGAPIKLGMVWNMTLLPDEKDAMAEIGMTAQSVYFDANALGLTAITTGMNVNDLNQLGLPSDQKPEIIMHVGHPTTPPSFTYNPLPLTNLPAVQNNTMTLAQAIDNRHITNAWDNQSLSQYEESQLIWASYGFSYNTEHTSTILRHRTLPSAIDKYPFKIYAANQTAVYRYLPESHSLTQILSGDQRALIQNAVGAANISLASAPWILLECLDTNVGSSTYQTWWYYEAGAISYNALLEAGSLNLSCSVIMDIADIPGLRAAIGISSQTNLVPQAVVGIGRPSSQPPQNHPPEQPLITGPSHGKPKTTYNYTVSTSDPDGDNVSYFIDWGDGSNSSWIGPYPSGDTITRSHSWAKKGSYTVRVQARDTEGALSDWADLPVTMPYHFTLAGFLHWLLERFPDTFSFLRHILNK